MKSKQPFKCTSRWLFTDIPVDHCIVRGYCRFFWLMRVLQACLSSSLSQSKCGCAVNFGFF